MDYSEIIGSSFRLAWRYKSLWLLGLFASGFGLYGFQSSFDLHSEGRLAFPGLGEVQLPDAPCILALAIGVALLMLLAAIFLNALCTPALIDAVNRLTRGGVYTLGNSLTVGFLFIWRTLGMMLIHFFVRVVLFAFIFLVLLAVLAVGLSDTLGPLLIIAAILLGIPLLLLILFAVETVFRLAYRAMVARDVRVADALAEGFALLRARPGPCAIIFTLYVALVIVISMIVAFIFVILAVPFVLLALSSGPGLILALLFGIPLFWIITLPVSGFLGAVSEAMYTIFYFRLLEPAPAVAAAPAAG